MTLTRRLPSTVDLRASRQVSNLLLGRKLAQSWLISDRGVQAVFRLVRWPTPGCRLEPSGLVCRGRRYSFSVWPRAVNGSELLLVRSGDRSAP